MDLLFHCPGCRQELQVDSSAAGSTLQCPACGHHITVPDADAANIRAFNPIAASAAAKVERHFSVPVHDRPSEVLVHQPKPETVEAPVAGALRMRVKIFRHTDCVEVGHDRYEEMVGAFLNTVGEPNVISITPLSYTHIDIGSQKILTDYAVQIIYKG